jgi:hypothetical protein
VAWGPHGAHSTHFGESVDGQRVSRTKPKHIKHRLKLRAPCESAPRALLAASSDGPGTGGRHVLQPSAVSRIYRNKSHSGLALSLRPRHPHVWRRQRSVCVGGRFGTIQPPLFLWPWPSSWLVLFSRPYTDPMGPLPSGADHAFGDPRPTLTRRGRLNSSSITLWEHFAYWRLSTNKHEEIHTDLVCKQTAGSFNDSLWVWLI